MESITFSELLLLAKKHIKLIVIATVVTTALAAGLSYVTANVSTGTHTAVASIYCDNYVTNPADEEYNYILAQEVTIGNARYAAVTSDVIEKALAGTGIDKKDLKVSSPSPLDSGKNNVNIDIVFIAVSSANLETSKTAANAIASVAVEQILDTLDYQTAYILQEAVPLSEVAVNAELGLSDTSSTSATVSKTAIVLGLGLGFFGSLFFVWCFELLGTKVRSKRDVECALGLPLLADLSECGFSSTQTTVPEEIRSLRSTLDFDFDGHAFFCVTDLGQAVPNGYIALDLARAFASAEYKTLLVDADVYDESVTSLLGISGLDVAEFAASDAPSDCFVAQEEYKALHVLPLSNPKSADALASAEFCKILEAFKTQYDVLIINTPSMAHSADVFALINRTNELVPLIHAKKMKSSVLAEEIEQLSLVGAHIKGVVLIGK